MINEVTCPVFTCTGVYIGQITFYKVPEKHGHVKLVALYFIKILSGKNWF